MARFLYVMLSAAIVSAGAAPAFAQVAPPPPTSQGLFGRSTPNPDTRETLDLTVSLAEGYDSDVPVDLRSTIDAQGLQTGGYSTMLNLTAEYARQRTRAQVGAVAASSLRYYASLDRVRSVSHNAGIGFTAQLPKRSALTVNQSAAYSPSYLYSLFPSMASVELGATPTAAPDYEVGNAESYAYNTKVALSHSLTRRSNVSAEGEFGYTDFPHETVDRVDLQTHGGRVQFSQNLARNTVFRAGYRYQTGTFGNLVGERMTEHGIEIGVDHTRRLSATRRATFGFKIGPSTLDVPALAGGDTIGGRHYRLLGDATFAVQLGKGWQAGVTGSRRLEYVADLTQPVFADGATADVRGLLTRRLDVAASAGYSNGESALSRSTLVYKTYTGNVRVRYALTSKFAGYVEYLHYFYDFGGSTQLPSTFPARFTRDGVRAGLMLRVPAVRR